MAERVILLALLIGCHASPGSTAATPTTPITSTTPSTSPRLVAEGVISTHVYTNDGYHSEHVFLPITINGHPFTAIMDVGTGFNDVASKVRRKVHRGDHASHATSLDTLPDTLGIGADTYVLRSGLNSDVPELSLSAMDQMFATIALPKAVPLPPVAAMLGTSLLERYDLVFDGPARRVRLYAPSAHPSTVAGGHRPPWLPPGLTLADCQPMGEGQFEGMVVIPLKVQGQPLRGFFDSGSPYNGIDLASAHGIGITEQSPDVHRIRADSAMMGPGGQLGDTTDTDPEYRWDTVQIGVGHHVIRDQVVHILTPGNPLNVGWMTLGLAAMHDQILLVSYSTGQVCLGNGH